MSTKEYVGIFKKHLGPHLDGHFYMQYIYNGSKIFERTVIKKDAYIISKDCYRYKIFSKFKKLDSRLVNTKDLSLSKIKIIFIGEKFIFNNMTIGKSIEYRKCLKKLNNSTPKNKLSNQLIINNNWIYIKLESLSRNELKPIISDRLNSKSKTRNIIFDLRNNYGGSLQQIDLLFKKLGIYYFNPYSEIIINKNIYTTQLEINRYLKYELNKSDSIYFKELVKGLENKINTKKTVMSKSLFKQKYRYQNNILVVTNNFCSSACEGIIKVLKQYKGTRIIGVNTSGSSLTEGGSPIIMPYSKIEVNFGYMLMVDMKKDYEYKELRGYLPDYWIEQKSLNLDKLMKIASNIFTET